MRGTCASPSFTRTPLLVKFASSVPSESQLYLHAALRGFSCDGDAGDVGEQREVLLEVVPAVGVYEVLVGLLA